MKNGLQKWLAIACFLFLIPPSASAQASLEGKNIGTAEGLPVFRVLALLQDHTGMLWLGTHDGLNRFDGKHFTTYRHKTCLTALKDQILVGEPQGVVSYQIASGTRNSFFKDNSEWRAGKRLTAIKQDKLGRL